MFWLLKYVLAYPLVFYGLICGLALIYLRRRRPSKYPPGPLSLPIIGNLHNIGTHPHETFAAMKKTYGNVIAVDFADKRTVILNDAKSIREAFSTLETSGRANLYALMQIYGGGKQRGLVTSEGRLWQEQRRFFLKTLRDFGVGKRSMEDLIQVEVVELVQRLSNLHGKPFRTQALFNVAVVNSLWTIITGHRFSQDDETLLQLVKYITESISEGGLSAAFLFFPTLCKWAPDWSGFSNFIGHHFKVRKIIREQIQEHKSTFQDDELRDVLDAALKEASNATDPASSFYKEEGEKNLLESLADLFYAGLETTSTTLSWITWYLSTHPEVQDKMFEEIKNVTELSRYPLLADRPKMPYLEAVILESIRTSSMVPLTMFHRVTKDIVFQDFLIPKDTMMMGNLHAVHHDPEVWGDPEAFRPERFIMADGTVNRHHEGLLLFGSGKRVCLGETLARDELLLFVAHIFQKFSVEVDPTKPKPEFKSSNGFVLVPPSCDYVLHERT